MSLSADRLGKGAVERAGGPEVAGGSGGGVVDAPQDPAEETYSPERIANLTQRGTRRLHLNTGDVWRVGEYHAAEGQVRIFRESDPGHERLIWLVYWLGDSWGSPKTRAGCRI